MRVGIMADTHIVDGSGISEMPDSVIQAIQGVDLILHLGDLGTSTKALDALEAIAPLKATRGRHNPDDERVKENTHGLDAGEVLIGMVFDLDTLGIQSDFEHIHDLPGGHKLHFEAEVDVPRALEDGFGQQVDVVAFAATHVPYVGTHQGVLFVNPDSPTLPEPGAEPQGVVKPAIAVLDIDNGKVTPSIVELGG